MFLNNRYLDPVLGRFVSVDPLVNLTRDAYGYGNNNPISYSDPSGLDPCSWCSGGGQQQAWEETSKLSEAELDDRWQNWHDSGRFMVGEHTNYDTEYKRIINSRTGHDAGGITPGAEFLITTAAVEASGIGKVVSKVVGDFVEGIASKFATRAASREMADAASEGWVSKTGNPIWPGNSGAIGPEIEETLSVGTRLGRFGKPGGSFVSPEGTPFAMRSLASGTDPAKEIIYEVIKDIGGVKSSQIAPWFGQPGGGLQHLLPTSVQWLLDHGYLELA